LGFIDGSLNDDGAGVVQSMEVLNIFKNLGKPKKYDSSSSFMNEENGLRGGKIRGVILVE
jgi:hypothetical protein